MSKPVVFVSYRHKDEKEKEHLVSHLKVLESAGVVKLWVDDRIEGGADWESEIKQAIAQARVAILLITANFLTSGFILGQEVPAFLERREQEGMTVFPVIAKACSWTHFEWLAKMNVRPKNARPIWSGKPGQIDEDLAKIAQEVAAVVKRDNTTLNPPVTASSGAASSSAAPDLALTQTKELLEMKMRHLHSLQMKKAAYGLSTPPHIEIEIEDLEAEITELKQKLNA